MAQQGLKYGIDLFTRKVENRGNAATRNLIVEFASRVIRRTPVKTGRARANWFLTLEAPSFVTNNLYDKTGGRTIAAVKGAIPRGDAMGHNYFFQNHLTYIKRLELGHSKTQAPQGMLGLTLIEMNDVFFIAVKQAQEEFA